MKYTKVLRITSYTLIFVLLLIPIQSISAVSENSSPSMTNDQVTIGRPEGVFKLLSYNIWETGRNITWINVVKEENPDIAIFVETGKWSSSDGTFDTALSEMNALNPLEKPYQGFATDAVSSTDGEALISRYPIRLKEQLDNLTLDDGTSFKPAHDFLHAIVEIDGLDVHFIGTHLACCSGGIKQRVRDQEGLMNYLDNLGAVPIIYEGDFNSHSPQDTGDIGPNDSNLGTEPIDMLINSSNPHASKVHTFTDVYRTLNPFSQGYTYVDLQYASRIDYTFVNQELTDTLVNSTVVTTKAGLNGADHRPLLSTFNMRYDEFDLRPPTQVSGLNASIESDSVKVIWDSNTEKDIFKYQIWKDDCLITELDKTATSFLDNSVTGNVLYHYWIVPADVNGNYGSPRYMYVNSSYGRIYQPSAPVLNASSHVGYISLNWTSSPNGSPITRTTIARSIFPDTGFIQVAVTNGFAYNDSSMRAGVTVYYRVQTFNLIGGSDLSNVVSGAAQNGIMDQSVSNSEYKAITIYTNIVNCPQPLNLIDFPTTSETSLTTSTSTINSSTSPSDFNSVFLVMIITFIAIPIIQIISKRIARIKK